MERLIRMDGNIVKLGSMETTIHGLILGAILTFIMFHHGSVDDHGWSGLAFCMNSPSMVEAKQLLERKHFESRVSMGGTPIHFRFPSGPPSSWGTSIWKPYSIWVERFSWGVFLGIDPKFGARWAMDSWDPGSNWSGDEMKPEKFQWVATTVYFCCPKMFVCILFPFLHFFLKRICPACAYFWVAFAGSFRANRDEP